MANYSITNPYPVILNQIGGGLNGGRVYIGVAGQDPETNPVTVYWDAAGTIVAAQPLATIGGYIVRNGSPAQVYGPAPYSIRVRDRFGAQIFYSPRVNDLGSPSGGGMVGFDWAGEYPDGTVGEALTNIQQPETGAFWDGWNTLSFPAPTNLDAKIQRMNDRLFVGAATNTAGDFPATTKDYYEQFEADHTSEFGFRTSWAQFAAGSKVGGIGVLGFARTSDTAIDIPFQLGVGGWFATINDNLVNPCLATGLYGVAFRQPGAGQGIAGVGTVGGEVDICNLGNSVQVTPGNLYPSTGFTTAWQINSGAYVDEAETASAAITIGNNKADFYAGIVIGQNAIAGVNLDPTTGQALSGGGSAFRFSAFHQGEWWVYPHTAPSFIISSRQITERATAPMTITAFDDGIYFGGEATKGLALRTVYPGGTTGAYLDVIPAYGSNPLTITPNGGGANENLLIKPKGAGAIMFGTYVNTPSGITGYISIVDVSGTPRKLAVIS